METQKKRRVGRILCVTLALVLVGAVAFGVYYVCDYYAADADAVAAFGQDRIEGVRQEDGSLVFAPEGAVVGLIFYPGGKVDEEAYIPLMQACAAQGILCVLLEMPLRLAVLDANAADGVQERFPEIASWYLGGHSLGGAMAGSYLADHAEAYNGLILLGAYSAGDLSETDLSVLSIYGSEDGVMDRTKYEQEKAKLPVRFTEVVLAGGCHAYFGMYGEQEGDGTPTMTPTEQITRTAELIGGFIKMRTNK